MSKILPLLILALLAPAAPARVWNVTVDGTGDAPTIQAAIDSAATLDTVVVHDGIYTGEGNKNLDFGGKDLIVRSANGRERTIIDCEGNGRGFYFHNFEGGNTTREAGVWGLTIRNGSVGNGSLEGFGGGIYSYGSFPTIRRCAIEGCVASEGGGGVAMYSGDIWLYSCAIAGNRAPIGGGVYWYRGSYATIDTCLIIGNEATDPALGGGGLAYDPVYVNTNNAYVEHTTIAGNHAAGNGGGIGFPTDYQPYMDLAGSIVWGNCAEGSGNDVYVHDGYLGIIARYCVLDTAEVIGALVIDCLDADPLFCAPERCASAPTTFGDYTLHSGSPALPENNPLGDFLIGALGEGCGGTTRVEPTTWGAVKKMFR